MARKTAGPLTKLFARAATAVDWILGWDRLPFPLSLITLIGYRAQLREKNLVDYGGPLPKTDAFEPKFLIARTVDGSYNNLSCPAMGMAGSRFGRNVPKDKAKPETDDGKLFEPNPFIVSRELLTRPSADDFKAVESLNLLAAAWIQFEIHDWFAHETDECVIDVPRPDSDKGPRTIPVRATGRDPQPVKKYKTFVNKQTHWWDGAQIYGADRDFQNRIRLHSKGAKDRGKVRINAAGFADPIQGEPVIFGGDGWWLGLELMSAIFLREHNAICDRLNARYPGWTDDQVFDKARLINTALIAKIHTTEWTPAILQHTGFQYGSDANWYGLLGKRARALFGRFGSTDLWSGVAGSEVELFDVPFSITEEFVAVYRMHPLMPDSFTFIDFEDNEVERKEFTAISGQNTRDTINRIGAAQVLYSMGHSHPGDITLHNSPWFMGNISLPSRSPDPIDLNALDILRCRERGVPRYNEFRKLLHLKPVTEFSEISGGDEKTEAKLHRIYKGKIDMVDTIVGMYGESRPEGFGFSDTAFRIFAVMAARRLESDRFYTKDFTPRVYTPEGMAWIEDNDMCSVLVRHYPKLEPVLRRQKNAFVPWAKVTEQT